MRENTACLYMDGFQVLPDEEELVKWLDEEVFKDEDGVRMLFFEGFQSLVIDIYGKKMLMALSTETQLQAFLSVMSKEGEKGRLWPGLEQEVRVRAEAMTKRSIEITVMDVAPETDIELVKQAMEKYGQVKRCKKMNLPAPYSKVIVNKVKIELVPNEQKLPNIIHAFGTTASADDFTTWKMQYRGCARYCFGCGATSHEARQCRNPGITKEKLRKVVSVVGEEVTRETAQSGLKLSYAAVLKDPTFLARQRREQEEEAQEARLQEEQEVKKREEKSARREMERQERISKEGEAEGLERARQEAQLELEQKREEPKLQQQHDKGEAQMNQEQKRKEPQLMSAPKEPARGRKNQLLTKEAQMEKSIVRDRSDSMGRKGAGKRPASPSSPDPVAPGAETSQKTSRVASPPYNFARALGALGKEVTRAAGGAGCEGKNK